MLTDQDKTELRKLNPTERKVVIDQQLKRIHIAVNDGSLDRATVDDALERLNVLLAEKRDSFAEFTGQKPKDETAPKPVDGGQPVA